MKTLWGVRKGFFMSRNEFDASHPCPARGNEEVPFIVYIGNPPICPSCHEIVPLEPVFVSTRHDQAIGETPRPVEESEDL